MYDLVIKNGKIIDGTGSPSYLADVAVSGGKIVRIDKGIEGGDKVIDAAGLIVTPGFIDSHSHSDVNMISYPDQAEKAEQGITTSISGQCGISIYPEKKKVPDSNGKYYTMGEFFDNSQALEQGSNIAIFAGHNNLRNCVMGMENRKPTAEELEEMKELLRDAIEHGALGVSFGLIYTPSCYADTDELIELAKVAGEYNALVAAHLRDEADYLVQAVEEFIKIIKGSGARGIISHHKAMYKENHGKVSHTLRMIEEANANGMEIYCDVYPYIASSTALAARFIPKELRKESERIVEFMSDEKIRAEVKEINLKHWGEDLSWVLINSCKGYPEYEGKTVDEISKIHGKDEYETIFDMLRDSDGYCQASFFSMCEEDVETVLAYPRAMICTDSGAASGKSVYHPRLRGSFPRVLGRYVRERKVTTLYEMIRKMTSMPAAVYGLKSKGILAEGFDADICIFDAEKIIDNADFSDCHKRADGLNYVIVGGEVAVENAVYNGNKNGKVLLRKVQ